MNISQTYESKNLKKANMFDALYPNQTINPHFLQIFKSYKREIQLKLN